MALDPSHDVNGFIERMRALGARRIRVGDVEVEFGLPPSASPALPPQPPETEEARKAREAKEYDAVLFHSS